MPLHKSYKIYILMQDLKDQVPSINLRIGDINMWLCAFDALQACIHNWP